MRRVKAIAAAVLAIAALSGVPAAKAAEFHSEVSPNPISGLDTTLPFFSTDPGNVTCKFSTWLTGTQQAATVTSWTLTPTYRECTLATIFGNIAVTVDFKGCDYQFDADGTVHILCAHTPANPEKGTATVQHGPVTISGAGCTITIPAQTLTKAASYSNTGTGALREIDMTINATGLTYSYSGFICGSGSNTKNGTHSHQWIISGIWGIWWA